MENPLQSDILLSIICCTHNRLAFVEKHFDRLRYDLPEKVELIYALDNCSDGTQAYLLNHSQGMPNVRVADYRGVGGLFYCRNFGLEVASGRYIHYLDDDDNVEIGYHHEICKVLGSGRLQGIDAYITGMTIQLGDGPKTRRAILTPSLLAKTKKDSEGLHVRGDIFVAVLRGEIYFNCANTIFSREFFARHRFRAEIRKGADWLLYLEAALSEDLHFVINESLQANYYIHQQSMSVAPDKSMWNASIFNHLLTLAPKQSKYHLEIREVCARANFDAGYGFRLLHKGRALKYYLKAIRLGLVLPSLIAMAKLPLAFLRTNSHSG